MAYTRFVSISVDLPEVAAAFRAGLEARWTFLCDPARVRQRRLELRAATDTVNDPYLPAAVLLKPNLEIHAEWDGYWYWDAPRSKSCARASAISAANCAVTGRGRRDGATGEFTKIPSRGSSSPGVCR